MSLHDQCLAVRNDLRSCLLERETAIDNALLALLSGEHYLQLGPTGTAKSLLVRAVCARIDGAQYFEKLMTSFTVPEELFGPVDLVGYADRGEYKRLGDGSLSQASIVFLDEVYKANSAILNSLLAIMNERLLHEVGMPPQHVPLLSLFAASNETPQDASLRALDDRFLLREVVGYVQEDTSFVSLVTAPLDINAVQATITLQEIQQAQQEVQQVKGTPEVLQALLALRQALSAEGIVVSDRKWRQCGKLLKASAWLDGLPEMDIEGMTCLVHALWTDPKERKTVERCVYEVSAPLYLRAVEIEDQAAEVFSKWVPSMFDDTRQGENILQQLVDAHSLLKEEIGKSRARNTSRALAALAQVETYHKAVATQLFKSVSRLSLSV
mgnify:FL=1